MRRDLTTRSATSQALNWNSNKVFTLYRRLVVQTAVRVSTLYNPLYNRFVQQVVKCMRTLKPLS